MKFTGSPPVAGGDRKAGAFLKIKRWSFRFAAALGCLHILIVVTPVLGWWSQALSAPWGPDDGDTLIVLGSDSGNAGMVGVSSYWRCFTATLLWRSGHFQRLVVSGVDAAIPMRNFLVAQGIPRDRILVENAANSTRENALFVRRLLPDNSGRKILLTSDYHSRRALAVFRKAGIEATALPSPDAGKRINHWLQRWDVFWDLSTETAKTIYYRARGWT